MHTYEYKQNIILTVIPMTWAWTLFNCLWSFFETFKRKMYVMEEFPKEQSFAKPD